MNPFFVMAIAEKVSALKTQSYFHERSQRADLANFDTWMTASPKAVPLLEGDDFYPLMDKQSK